MSAADVSHLGTPNGSGLAQPCPGRAVATAAVEADSPPEDISGWEAKLHMGKGNTTEPKKRRFLLACGGCRKGQSPQQHFRMRGKFPLMLCMEL